MYSLSTFFNYLDDNPFILIFVLEDDKVFWSGVFIFSFFCENKDL